MTSWENLDRFRNPVDLDDNFECFNEWTEDDYESVAVPQVASCWRCGADLDEQERAASNPDDPDSLLCRECCGVGVDY